MAHQISRIRNRVTLMFAATTVAATVFLLFVVPVVSDLAPQAARASRLNYLIIGPLFLVATIASLQVYLRPISDLGYALEIGSTPTAELGQKARKIAFNAPVYFFVLPTCGVLILSLLANVVGTLFWPEYVFGEHLLSTVLSTASAACCTLVLALGSRQLMRPVLLYTAPRFQADGIRLNVRTRLFVSLVTVIVLALLFPGVFGYTHVVKVYREQTAETNLLLLDNALAAMLDVGQAEVLDEVVKHLDASVEYDHLLLIDNDGRVLEQYPSDGPASAFDSRLWLRKRPSRLRQERVYFVLRPLDPERWVGIGYVVQPFRSREVVRAVFALSTTAVLALALGALISHYLATDVVCDLRDVKSRLLEVAHEERVDLSALVPVLSLDEVGDLILAYNKLQERVRNQQEQIESKQRQLLALQSLSYKIGTIRDLDHLLQEVIRDVERAFGYHNVSILFVDEQNQELYIAAVGLADESIRDRRFRVGKDGVVGRVAGTGAALLINDVSACDFYIPDKTNTRAELAVPLSLGDKVIGVFNVSSERIGAFDENDLRIVTALGNQVAIAIENTRLFGEVTTNAQELERRARNMTILNDISNSLSTALRLEDVLQTATEQLVSLFDLGHCSVFLFGEDDEFGEIVAEHPDHGLSGERVRLKGFPVIKRMLAAPSPLYIADAQRSEQLKPIRKTLQELDIQSALIVPLVSKGIVEGFISLNAVGKPRLFTAEEMGICRTVSAQVAVAIENVQLIESLSAQTDMLARMARDVAAERSQLDAILRNLADGLLVTDPEGNIVLFNPAFLTLFGLAESGLKGQLVTKIIPELPLQNLIIQTARAKAIHVQEMTLPDGRHFQITAAGVHEQDKLSGVVMILRDVTRERQLDKMKSDFISTVSHEFRTPLTPVLGFAKLIRKAFNRNILPTLGQDDKDAQRAATRINQNLDILIGEVGRLSALVDDVLFLADLDAGRLKWKMEEVDLRQALQLVVDKHRSLAEEKGLALRTEWPDDLPLIHGDRERLLRVITNLVSNAVKFTAQGEVTVLAQQLQRQDGQWMTPTLVRPPDQLSPGVYVLVSVGDTGPGISPEAQQTLFERFGQGMRDTLTEKPAGTQLGLALSKEIISHHNGWIWVESEIGKGSTFSFVLPLSPEGAEMPLVGDDLALPETAPTILVVDDEPAVRELLYYVLLQAGYRSLMAVDGPTALNMARVHNPDLIILDIMIPGISGLDVTSVLKADEATRDIPIVILSILADEQKAAQLGAEACFSKPFDQDEFIQKVAELLTARKRSARK
jgi:PAS domain S-box-containing protein